MKHVYVVMAPDIPKQAKAYGIPGANHISPLAYFDTPKEAEYFQDMMTEKGFAAFIFRVEQRKYSRQWMAAHPLKKH